MNQPQDKIKIYKNGAYVIMSAPSFPSGMTRVKAYTPEGGVYDSILCDSRSGAREYFRAFCAAVKTL